MIFYAPRAEKPQVLRQGDILASVPFAYFPLQQAKVTLEGGGSEARDLTEAPERVEFVAAHVSFSWGMILTQTCDLQPDPQTGYARKPIIIARVRPIKELVRTFRDDCARNSLRSVSELANPGKMPALFYLPACRTDDAELPRSGADLLDIQRFDVKDLPSLRRLARLRLGVEALQALQERCAYCFGRFAAPDGLFLNDEELDERRRADEARLQNQSTR